MKPRSVKILHAAVVVACGGFVAFLLSPQGDLSGHDTLSLCNKATIGTGTITPLTEAFVSFED